MIGKQLHPIKRPLALLLVFMMAFGLFLPSAPVAWGDDSPAGDAGAVTVTIANDSAFDEAAGAPWEGYLAGDETGGLSVPIQPGDTMMDVIEAALKEEVNGQADYAIDNGKGYITSIHGLAAGAATAVGKNLEDMAWWDGWAGAINGIMPSVGFGSIYVKDGDVIDVSFSLDGSIVGASWGNYNSLTEGFSFSAGKLNAVVSGWSTALTLILPADIDKIKVKSIPDSEGRNVSIYVIDDQGSPSLDSYDLEEDIPVQSRDTLRIVVDDYATVYEIKIRIIGTDDIDIILENIASGYTENSSEWIVMDMAAYKNYNLETTSLTSETAFQSYLNYAISVVNDYTKAGSYASPDAEYAKAIITLQSIGINPRILYRVNSNTPLDAVVKLKATSTTSIYNAPYVLLALAQGTYDSTVKEQALIRFLLQEQDAVTHAWGYENKGFNADVDGTVMVISALAPYYSKDVEVKDAVDKALLWLSQKQQNDGTFLGWGDNGSGTGEPSANTTAVVIIALCALGIDPTNEEDPRAAAFIKQGGNQANNTIDGLLSLASSNLDGFTAGGVKNSAATEQGFRALIAYAGLMQKQATDPNASYSIYDFSSNTVIPGRATGEGSVTTPGSPNSKNEMTVTFRMEGLDGKVWIPTRSVTIADDAKVYHVFQEVLDGLGFAYEGAETGYVRSVTRPSGTTLAEFTYGLNSGWLYKVNDVLQSIGLTEYSLKDGDSILWYYTRDWEKDSSAGSYSKDPNSPGNIVSTDTGASGASLASFTDVTQDDWFYDAVAYVLTNGLFSGTSETTFAPGDAMTRGMFATVLWRLAGKPAPASSAEIIFTDVPADLWYSEAALWAAENKIILGYGDGRFGPMDPVNREQMAVMIARYIEYKDLTTNVGNVGSAKNVDDSEAFADMDKVSSWAKAAVNDMQKYGIINGKGDGLFMPKDNATRAEAAALFQRLATIPLQTSSPSE